MLLYHALERGNYVSKEHAGIYGASLDVEAFYNDVSKLIDQYNDDGNVEVSILEDVIVDSANILAFLAESSRTPFGVAIGFALTGVGLAVKADQAANGDTTGEIDVSELVNQMQAWANSIESDTKSMAQGLSKVYAASMGKAVDSLQAMNESEFNQFLYDSDPVNQSIPQTPQVAAGTRGARVHYIPNIGGNPVTAGSGNDPDGPVKGIVSVPQSDGTTVNATYDANGNLTGEYVTSSH